MATPILPRVLWCAWTAAALALGVVCTRPVAALSCDFTCYAVEGTLAECSTLPPDQAGAQLLDVTLIDATVHEVPCRHAGAHAGTPRITDASAALQRDGRFLVSALAHRCDALAPRLRGRSEPFPACCGGEAASAECRRPYPLLVPSE